MIADHLALMNYCRADLLNYQPFIKRVVLCRLQFIIASKLIRLSLDLAKTTTYYVSAIFIEYTLFIIQ